MAVRLTVDDPLVHRLRSSTAHAAVRVQSLMPKSVGCSQPAHQLVRSITLQLLATGPAGLTDSISGYPGRCAPYRARSGREREGSV